MEDNKIRVGITQGDINGVGYEVILKTFSDPVMLELCTPIIYGSPKVAAYHLSLIHIYLEGADMETMTKLRDYLTSHGLFTTIRASRGEDIFAACGMLSTAKQEENKQELI